MCSAKGNKMGLFDFLKKENKKPEYRFDKEYGFVSSLFNSAVSVSATNVSEEYIKNCIDFIQNPDDAQIDLLVKESIRYYQEFIEISGSDTSMPEDIEGREILKYITPKVMYIGNDDEEPEKMEFIVECDCKWEPEHGLEIIVYDKKIIHVGSYDGDIDYWKEEYLKEG